MGNVHVDYLSLQSVEVRLNIIGEDIGFYAKIKFNRRYQ